MVFNKFFFRERTTFDTFGFYLMKGWEFGSETGESGSGVG